jgi:hypothetical protein
VTIPPLLYGIVAERVAVARTRARGRQWRRFLTWADFLAYRCSREFLETYLTKDPSLVERSLSFGPYMSDVPELPILARLHEAGLLAEQDRLQVRETIGYLAVEEPDASWIDNDSVSTLLTEEEFLAIQARIKNELVPGINRMLRHWKRNEQGESAESYYQPLLDTPWTSTSRCSGTTTTTRTRSSPCSRPGTRLSVFASTPLTGTRMTSTEMRHRPFPNALAPRRWDLLTLRPAVPAATCSMTLMSKPRNYKAWLLLCYGPHDA